MPSSIVIFSSRCNRCRVAVSTWSIASTWPVRSALVRAVESRIAKGLDAVRMGTIRVPEVLEPLKLVPDPRLFGDQPIASGSARLPVYPAVAGGIDAEERGIEREGEIGVPCRQLDDHRSRAVRTDVGDGGKDGGTDRLRAFAAMVVERCDDILGRHRLAVVELDTVPQHERPDFRVGRTLPSGGQRRLPFVSPVVWQFIGGEIDAPTVRGAAGPVPMTDETRALPPIRLLSDLVALSARA